MKNLTWIFVGLLLAGLTGAYYGADYGTSAYYSVSFDDRGLANAVLRLDYTNNADSAASTIDLNIPGTDVRMVGAYQKRDCIENGSVDYSSCYYNYEFDPVTYEKAGAGSYRLKLGKPLEKGHSTSLLILYRAFGYAKSGILGTGFDFETPKYGFDVDSTQVSINVDQGLYLKEGGSSGNYQPIATDMKALESGSGDTQAAMSGLYSYSSYSYGYTTQKSTLFAGESMVVSGSYGRNKMLLYAPEIAFVLALLGLGAYFVRKKARETNAAASKGRQGTASPAQAAGARTVPAQAPLAQGVAPLSDCAVKSFVYAVSFAALVAVTVVSGAIIGVNMPDAQVAGFVFLVAWLGSAYLVYERQQPWGRGKESAMMFIGFSVIVIPFMLGVALVLYRVIMPSDLYYL